MKYFSFSFIVLILVFIISSILVSCQKEDTPTLKYDSFDEQGRINIKTLKNSEIPNEIITYLKEKTNSTFKFNLSGMKIEPISEINTLLRDTLEIGTVNTTQAVVVINEYNTTYSFDMDNGDTSSTYNLIVVDIDGSQINYYIQYQPVEGWLDTHSLRHDMNLFTGNIIFYNRIGLESGTLYLENGEVNLETSDIIENPCNNDTFYNDEETVNDESTTGTGSGGNSSPDGSSGSNPNNDAGGSSDSGGSNTNQMCEYSIGMTCSGDLNHTEPDAPGCTVHDGWTVTFYMPCLRATSNVSRFSANREPIDDPCTGNVGFIEIEFPCPGDPIANPELVSSSVSGKEGSTFGCTRIGDTDCPPPKDKNHDGIDIKADLDSNTYAMYSGTVSSIRNTFSSGEYKRDSYGNFIILNVELNGSTHFIKYNHLNSVDVNVGQTVNVGDIIGANGNTGNAASSGVTPHIHLQVFNSDWQSIDPSPFLGTQFDENYNPIQNPNCN